MRHRRRREARRSRVSMRGAARTAVRPASRRRTRRTLRGGRLAGHDLPQVGVPSPHPFARQVRAAEPEVGVIDLDEVDGSIDHIPARRRDGEQRLRRTGFLLANDGDDRHSHAGEMFQMTEKLAVPESEAWRVSIELYEERDEIGETGVDPFDRAAL